MTNGTAVAEARATDQPTVRKVSQAQVIVEQVGHTFKHLVVSLMENQTIVGVREDPDCWTHVQSSRSLVLRPGDRVTIVSDDGLTIAESCAVVRTEGGRVWLSKPLRQIKLERVSLWSEGSDSRLEMHGVIDRPAKPPKHR